MDIRNAEEFLLHPSLETLNLLPKPKRIDLVKEALEVHITDVNAMCRSFVQVSSVLRDNTETLVVYTDIILREAFKISGKPETVVNGLLIHMGLLKSEDKIKPTTNDITGSLLALEYAVKQEYFPKNLALYFIAFLSKPHSAKEGSSPARNSLLQTLQHL